MLLDLRLNPHEKFVLESTNSLFIAPVPPRGPQPKHEVYTQNRGLVNH